MKRQDHLTQLKKQVLTAFKEYRQHTKTCARCVGKQPCEKKAFMLGDLAAMHTMVHLWEHALKDVHEVVGRIQVH